MKPRLTAVFATVVVALSLAAGASAAPHKSTVRGWDVYSHRPADVYSHRPGGSTWSSLHFRNAQV
jgi:hypothetical protein